MRQLCVGVLISMVCCCFANSPFAADVSIPDQYRFDLVKRSAPFPIVQHSKTRLERMNATMKQAVQEAFQSQEKHPVSFLVRVVQNPYASSAATPASDKNKSQNQDETSDTLAQILTNPGDAINNLLSPTGAIGQVGVGLTVHF